MSVMAPDPRPDPQVQLTPLPAQDSAATVSISYSKVVAKLTMQLILKKLSKNKLFVPTTISSTSPKPPERRAMSQPYSITWYPGGTHAITE